MNSGFSISFCTHLLQALQSGQILINGSVMCVLAVKCFVVVTPLYLATTPAMEPELVRSVLGCCAVRNRATDRVL